MFSGFFLERGITATRSPCSCHVPAPPRRQGSAKLLPCGMLIPKKPLDSPNPASPTSPGHLFITFCSVSLSSPSAWHWEGWQGRFFVEATPKMPGLCETGAGIVVPVSLCEVPPRCTVDFMLLQSRAPFLLSLGAKIEELLFLHPWMVQQLIQALLPVFGTWTEHRAHTLGAAPVLPEPSGPQPCCPRPTEPLVSISCRHSNGKYLTCLINTKSLLQI